MIGRKIILGLFVINFLGACTAPTAILGPAYTLTTSGNALQAGLSYGSNEVVTRHTGKTPLENLKEFSQEKNRKINIQKQTLESEEFYLLVKNKIEKKSGTFKISSQ